MFEFSAECRLIKSRRYLMANGVDDSPGCYAVFDANGLCLYVGRAVNLIRRIYAHFIDQEDGHGYRWRITGTVEWQNPKPFAPRRSVLKIIRSKQFKELEKELIVELSPVGNRRGWKRI